MKSPPLIRLGLFTKYFLALTILVTASLTGCNHQQIKQTTAPTPDSTAIGTLLVSSPAKNLLGVWQASYMDSRFGSVSVEMILQNNGRFQKQTLLSGVPITTIYGTFQVFKCQGRQCLRLNIERGEPARWCGPLGCIPLIYPAGESYYYNLMNNNTLVLEFCDGTPGNCTWRTLNFQRG